MISADLQAKNQRLAVIIKDKSLKTGEFVLASGAKSNYLFDLKTTLLDPEGANLAADILLDKLRSENIDAVGGLELGACPIVSSICVKAYLLGMGLRTFYVRKEKKERGSNNLIEGCQLTKGDKIIIVEDVTTKGGSALKAVKVVQELGCIVNKVLSIIDRQEGAKENLAKEGIELDSIFTKNDFI